MGILLFSSSTELFWYIVTFIPTSHTVPNAPENFNLKPSIYSQLVLMVTSVKQPPVFKVQYYEIQNIHFNSKLTCSNHLLSWVSFIVAWPAAYDRFNCNKPVCKWKWSLKMTFDISFTATGYRARPFYGTAGFCEVLMKFYEWQDKLWTKRSMNTIWLYVGA